MVAVPISSMLRGTLRFFMIQEERVSLMLEATESYAVPVLMHTLGDLLFSDIKLSGCSEVCKHPPFFLS